MLEIKGKARGGAAPFEINGWVSINSDVVYVDIEASFRRRIGVCYRGRLKRDRRDSPPFNITNWSIGNLKVFHLSYPRRSDQLQLHSCKITLKVYWTQNQTSFSSKC